MSDQMFSIKIDVKNILKEHLFNATSGAVYLDCTMIPSRESKYGDSHFLVQSLPKAMRESGQRGPIIGNAKMLGASRPLAVQSPNPKAGDGPDEEPPAF